jgi:alkylhydroperoxidase family enzyme
VDLAVGAFAVHRLTRLATEDDLTRPLRALAAGEGELTQEPARPRVAAFLSCPWCVSVWAAAGWLALTAAAPRLARPLGAVLAWSSATGLLSSWE